MAQGRFLITLAVLAALGLTVSACGRRAGLDTPYQAALDAQREAAEQAEEEGVAPPPPPAPPVVERDFFLDGLI